MLGFSYRSRLAPGILSFYFCLGLASISLSGPASAGIIAIGGTAKPSFVTLPTLTIPLGTYRRVDARLSYRPAQVIEIEFEGKRFLVKKQGSCIVDANELTLFIPDSGQQR